MNTIFTIGHSNHSFEQFAMLLTRHGVTTVADVRAQPLSRFRPHFNRNRLSAALAEITMDYVFIGDELGARRNEPEAYVGDQARYDLIRRLPRFQIGIDRILDGAINHRIALMCAEKDPLDCHRCVLIGRELRNRPDIAIAHILADGSLESQEATENRLVALVGGSDMFETLSRASRIETAYDARAEDIAYRRAGSLSK